jgi:Ca2+-binding RTX toxin-like protein
MTDKTSKKPNYVIDPKAKIAGKTQAEWGDKWFQWSGSIPLDDNPLFDNTGDFASVNQTGSVYFLGGKSSFGSNFANRKAIVPQGKTLFFPIISFDTFGNDVPEFGGDTRFANPGNFGGIGDIERLSLALDSLSDFSLTIDGKTAVYPIDAKQYLQSTQDLKNGFSISLPENNPFGIFGVGPEFDNRNFGLSYQTGYYIGLNPLSPGEHTIQFKATAQLLQADGSTTPTSQDISYTIDVKPFNKDIVGDDQNNTLKGNWCNDNIKAGGGDDTVYGYGGDDIIDGGSGNDKLYGGDGNDIVYGGAGNDLLDGGNGDDVLAGGLGDDKIYGGAGNDRLYGGSGKDEIYGGNGNDIIYGGNGNDKIDGGNGDDVIDAVAYSKLVLPFSSSKDQIDTIKGGGGRDTFVLGMAGDKKAGVTGSKYYVGGGDKDYALIQDFQLGSNGDKIQLYSQTTNPNDYVLGGVTNGLPNGVGIYTNDIAHDLIGIVQGQNVSLSTLSLTNNSQFNLVG